MNLVATNIGKAETLVWKGKELTTGIFKYPVETPIFLDTEQVRGDAICNRKNHGGIHQAVYGYSLKHYRYWKATYPNLEWSYGMFGENLTFDDLDETNIHVGDTFTLGDTIIEATLQRNPCMKLGVRFNDMSIVKAFWNTTMCGVYFKILQTGYVQAGDQLIQIKQCPKNPTIADLYAAKRIEKGV